MNFWEFLDGLTLGQWIGVLCLVGMLGLFAESIGCAVCAIFRRPK